MKKFGRIGIKTDYRTLKFANYVTPDLPPPPPRVDTFDRVMNAISDRNFSDLFPMDGNDQLGDCTIAGWAHAVTLYRGMAGTGIIPATSDIVDLYLHLTGGVDSGLYCLDVMKYVKKHHALDGGNVLAYVAINPKDHTHVKQAMQIFGCVYLGFQVQANCIADFEARHPWDAGPLEQSGHCVLFGGYDDDTGLLRCATWGSDQYATWPWWDECVDEVYAILPADAADPDFAPGLDLAQLKADLRAVSA